MAKNLNVQMTITADSSQAKREMKSLQDQLSKLGQNLNYGKGFGDGISKNLAKTKQEIAELQVALQKATNVDTGKLDFTRFNEQLKLSGRSLSEYATTLASLGTTGQQAFLSLSKAIAKAEVPTIRLNKMFTELGTTLANTARWQISSSVLHGFMGAVQGAYGYAQKLDTSLNNIRIVTGLSTDEMAKFADQANSAAQALGTTTTAYTDAALIYYQQGIRDQDEIRERVEATIKLANVTHTSAEEVSSQLTAIWNNFDDGTKTLEYYADAITALGAATASSSAEIAQGLEKFAAVSETVGLSYEYATAALATVVATTRQSADVVGTSFKTLFARLEGLELGETLEDGTDLNKYSKALYEVGVNIKDDNGQLKQMNEILDELGAKWKTLSNEEQVALAQTVGGVRQYAQLIALMNEYDKFKENVDIASSSLGTLAQQQNIYMESWTSSTERLNAAWEELYNLLIDKNFFTSVNDGLSGILNFTSSFIKDLGGLKGLLLTLSPIIFNVFGEQLKNNIQNAIFSLKMMLPGVKELTVLEQQQSVKNSLNTAKETVGKTDPITYKRFEEEINFNATLEKYKDHLTEEQIQILKLTQEQRDAEYEIQKSQEQQVKNLDVVKNQKMIAVNRDYAGDTETQNSIKTAAAYRGIGNAFVSSENIESDVPLASQFNKNKGMVDYVVGQMNKSNSTFSNLSNEDKAELEALNKEFTELSETMDKSEGSVDKFSQAMEELINKVKTFGEKAGGKSVNISGDLEEKIVTSGFAKRGRSFSSLESAQNTIDNNNKSANFKDANDLQAITDKVKNEVEKAEEEASQKADELAQTIGEQIEKTGEIKGSQEALNKTSGDIEETAKKFEAATIANTRFSEGIVNTTKVVSGLGSAFMQINSLQNVWKGVADGNVELGQALAQTATTLGMLIPTITSVTKALASESAMTQLLTTQEETQAVLEAKNLIIDKLKEKNATKYNTLQATDISLRKLKIKLMLEEAAAQKGLIMSSAALLAALVALVALYQQLKYFDETYGDLSSAAGSRGEELQKQKEENKSLKDKLNTLEELNKEYKEGNISQEDYRSKLEDNIETLREENEELATKLNYLSQLNNPELLQGEIARQQENAENEERALDRDILQSGRDQLFYAGLSNFTNELFSLDYSTIAARGAAMNDNLFDQYDNNGEAFSTLIAGNGFGLANENEKRLLADIEKLNLSGVSTAFETLSITPDQMSDQDMVTLMNFLSEASASGEYGENNDILKNINSQIPNLVDVAERLSESFDNYSKNDALADVRGYIETELAGQSKEQQAAALYSDDIINTLTTYTSGAYSEALLKTVVDEILNQDYTAEQKAAGIGLSAYKQNETYSQYYNQVTEGLNGVASEERKSDIIKALNISPSQFTLAASQSGFDFNDSKFLTQIQAINEGLSGFSENIGSFQSTIRSLEQGKTFDKAKAIESFTKSFNISSKEFTEAYGDFIVDYVDGSATFIGDVDEISQNLRQTLINNRNNFNVLLTDTEEMLVDKLNEINGTEVTRENYKQSDIQNARDQLGSNLEIFSDIQNQGFTSQDELIDYISNSLLENGIWLPADQIKDMDGIELHDSNLIPDWAKALFVNEYGENTSYGGVTDSNLSNIIQNQIDETNGQIRDLTLLTNQISSTRDDISAIDFTALPGNGIDELQESYGQLGGSAEEYDKYSEAAALVTAENLDLEDSFKEYTEYLLENVDAVEGDRAAAARLALMNQRINLGIQDLADNIDTYTETLEKGEEHSEEYAEAINGIEESLQNVFNTDDNISKDFILEHLDDVKKAATGDTDAINRLKIAYAQLLTSEASYASGGGAEEALRKVEEAGLGSYNTVEELYSALYSVPWDDIEIGASMDADPALQALQQFLTTSRMTGDQVQKILDSIGYDAKLEFAEETLPDGSKVSYVSSITNAHYTGKANKPTTKSSSSKGKGSSRSKKDKKDYKDEFERYYTINRQIQDQIDEVERLGKAKDRAWGKAKLELLDKESDALQTQIDLQNEKIKQVEQYYKYDQERLNFFGAQYDENGVVTNYDEMVKREVDAYNKAVDRYNNGGGEGAFSLAEDRYNKFKEILKQYDETNQLWQSEMDKLTDLKNEYYDMQLEKIQTKVEMDIEVDDSDLKVLEYELDRIRKKAFSTAEAIAKIGEQLDVNLDKQKVYNDALEDILANHGISDIGEINNLDESTIANLGFTADEIDALQEYNENLLETQKELNQLEEDILNGPVEAFKEWNDEFDYQEDKIENNINLLKQYKNIADLIYSNSRGVTDQFLYGIMNNTYNNMVTGVGAAYTEWQANKAALAEAMAAYEESIAAGADEQTITLLRNNLREMEEMVDDSRDDMLKKTEEALKQAEDLLKQFVENAAKAAKEAFSATDWDMTKFDRLKTLDDEYLDDYEKIYELSKLTRDVNNSMDSMDTIRGKERLKEITQEIAEIEESNKEISQYEVDALRKKYELRLAEIALEDAQAAKNTVRMSRDNDGNWSYVYTADDSKVDKARQNYEDKLYEYQKLNSDFIKIQQENFLKLEQEYTDAMQKIAEDSSLNEEDKLTRLQETQAYYQRMAEIMTDQLGIALDKNSELYHKDWLDYSKMTDYKISKLEDYQTQIEFTYTGYLQPNIESAMDLLTQFTNATVGEGGYFPQIVQGLEEFKDRQDEVLHAAGTTLEDYAMYVEDAMYAAGDSSVKASDEVSLAALTMREAFDQVIAKINELNQKNLSSVRNDIETTVKSIAKLVSAYKDVSNQVQNTQKAMQSAIATAQQFNSSVNSSGSGSGGGGSSSTYAKSTPTTAAKVGDYYKALLDKNKNLDYRGQLALIRQIFGTTNSSEILNLKFDVDKARTAAEKYDSNLYKLHKFDTGGYTGTWGSEGRLAMLHQKELVLNAHDTENMLNTIQMVRDIVASIDTRAAAAGVMNINAGYAGNANAGAQDLNQNVHIEANFPNATDHNEIELALTNLVNRASQYAGRKKP